MTDRFLEKFSQLSTYRAAYMRDVVHTMHHDIQSFDPEAKVIGRAYTVKGPDIYLNALESIPEGSVYVHAGASNNQGVWSGWLARFYGKPRGLVATVIDGGVNNRQGTVQCEIPTFARFVSPSPAVNREEGIIQVPVVCGGVSVCPGDIVLGDGDGVVVIPVGNEREIYDKLDGFLGGVTLFQKIAGRPGIVITQHEALREMLALKYEHPHNYWRYYEQWAAKWQQEYGD